MNDVMIHMIVPSMKLMLDLLASWQNLCAKMYLLLFKASLAISPQPAMQLIL